jgi:guanylate kinase
MSVSNHDFIELLTNYRPSQTIIDLMQRHPPVLVVSPTSTGKNSIIARLVETGKYGHLISDTTRPSRINNGQPEKNGQVYWYISRDDFYLGLKAGDYVEATIYSQQVYGTSVKEFRKVGLSGKIPITDVDMRGCDHIKYYCPAAKAVFLLPPSFEEWMRRLRARNVMDETEKHRRLLIALQEIDRALSKEYFKFFINDQLELAAKLIDNYVSGTLPVVDYQLQAKTLANQLKDNIKDYLN